jgi:hypothetical protein
MKNTDFWDKTPRTLIGVFKLFLLFVNEDGSSTFLRKAGKFKPDYTASPSRRQYTLDSIFATKKNRFILLRETVAVCAVSHMEHKHTLWAKHRVLKMVC